MNPLIRQPVYSYHIQNTYDFTEISDLGNLYLSSSDPHEVKKVMVGATHTRLIWALNSLLRDLLRDDMYTRKEDFFEVINYVSRNPAGRHLAFYFIRHYWDEIVQK